MNKRAKGNYYVKKTQKWLEGEGYTVAGLEHSRTFTYRAKDGAIKRGYATVDIWGADLMARNTERLVFIQVKANKGDVSAGVRQLSEDDNWPDWTHRDVVERWVAWWPPRQKTTAGPEITEVT